MDYNKKTNEKQVKETVPTMQSELTFPCNITCALQSQ